ncbi:MAG: hypothetical protein KJ060_06675 [Candidatus Hydrogenedentes bacterium]|nr:hypothetical protein [Candidatus Hydrogenedentota bacterium]
MSDLSPNQVLDEAIAAAKEGRYEEALEKHVWYHENALRLRPSLCGVRLTYAIFAWRRLGYKYPTALERFRAMRDETARQLCGDETNSDLFSDLVTFNDILDEPEKTVEVFRWLDANKPEKAKPAYIHAHPVLIEQHEYALCGKYLVPKLAFEIAVATRNAHERIAVQKDKEGYKKQAIGLRHFANQSFSNTACTLVALLAVNDRKEEAEEYAAKFRGIADDTTFHADLQKALDGVVPKRWPPIEPRLWQEEFDKE